MTDAELAAARALCDAAIDAPWSAVASEDFAGGQWIVRDANGFWTAYVGEDAGSAAFIAAARTGWPAALDEVERLRELAAERYREIERARSIIEAAKIQDPELLAFQLAAARAEAEAERNGRLIAERALEADSLRYLDCARKDDQAEITRLSAEVEAMRPVVEAAEAVFDHIMSPGVFTADGQAERSRLEIEVDRAVCTYRAWLTSREPGER